MDAKSFCITAEARNHVATQTRVEVSQHPVYLGHMQQVRNVKGTR
jgi:hypothetical protein